MSTTTTTTTTTTSTLPTMKITLKAGGARSAVSEAEAVQILSRFQSTLDSMTKRFSSRTVVVQTLDLSGRAWSPEALKVLQPFLVQHVAPTVEILKMDDMIASLPTDQGLATLTMMADTFSSSKSSTGSRIVEVNANDNALGTRGLVKLQSLLSLPTVQRVYLENCGLSGEATIDTLHACFVQSSSSSSDNSAPRSPLTHLALGRNQMGIHGAQCVGKILSSCPCQLQYFNYQGSRPMPEGTLALLQGLVASDTSQLAYLDLNDSNFKASLELLSQLLKQSPRLTHLILRDGELKAQGLTVVLQALSSASSKCCRQLRVLDLGAILTDDDDLDANVQAAVELAAFVRTQWTTLEQLLLDCNEWTSAGVVALVSELGGSPASGVLKVLNLEQTSLEGADALYALAGHPIPSLTSLVLLDNMELTYGPALNLLRQVYPNDILQVDDEEDLEPEEDNDDADVDALAGELATGAKIADSS